MPEQSNRWWVDPPSYRACATRIPSSWRSSRIEKDLSPTSALVGATCTKKCIPVPSSAQIDAESWYGCCARRPVTPSVASAPMTFNSMRVSGCGVASPGDGDGAGEKVAGAVGGGDDAKPTLAPCVTDGAPVAGALRAGAHAVKRQATSARCRMTVTLPLERRTRVRLGPTQLIRAMETSPPYGGSEAIGSDV